MKVTISLDLADLDNFFEYQLINAGSDMYSALIDIDNFCRGKIKHGEISDEESQSLECIRDFVTDSRMREIYE